MKIRGNKLISCSPFRSDNSPSFAINLDNGTFIDSGNTDDEWYKGNFIKLITFFTGETYNEAFNRLNKTIEYDFDSIRLHINLNPLNTPLNALERVSFKNTSNYLLNRGISSEIQRKFNCVEEKGLIKFPVVEKGKHINTKYRKTKSKVFWYDTDGLPIKQFLYGIDKALEYSYTFVVEGEIDVLSFWELGYPAVGTFGASFTETQINKLTTSFKDIILVPDNDTVGKAHATKMSSALNGKAKIFTLSLPTNYKDINDLLLDKRANKHKIIKNNTKGEVLKWK